MSQSMEDTATRVLALAPIDGSVDPSEADVLLLRQYFGNVDALAKSVAVWKGGPFFDPRNVIGRDLSPEHAQEVNDVAAKLVHQNGYVKHLCVAAVVWAGYAVEGERLACEHDDLFEPLLRLFEKGIGFTIHHGEILIGRFALPLSTWRWVFRGNRWEPPDTP
jgi:hypothetical protein